MRTTTTALAALGGLLMPLAAVGAMAVMSPAQAADETCDGRPATIVVAADPTSYRTDPVVGTPGDDVILGTSGADTIDGAGGNDIICGFASEDHITGGTGDDRLFGGLDRHYEGDDSPYVGDLLVPGPGDDHVDLGVDLDSLKLCDCYTYMTPDRVSYADSTTGVKVDLATGLATGEGRDSIVGDGHFGVIGSAFDDHLIGTDGPNDIEAGVGADTVDAGAGDDWVYLDAPPVRRELNGTTTDSTPLADDGDTLDAGEGDDRIAFTGGDRIDSGSGDDEVRGKSNARLSVSSGKGRDSILLAGTGSMAVRAGADKDIIRAAYTRQGRHVLDGGSGSRDSLRLRIAPSVPAGAITINLPQRRISVAGHKPTVRLAGLESFDVVGKGRKTSGLTFIGSNRADHFGALDATFPVHADGRGGDDFLFSGYGKDVLDGGPGHDTLNARYGRDRCLNGEKVTDCEARR
ncbi:calcium-binding protein [Nocardioides terrigena]|uniref:calcium-binding protein n=1 Tax=Nocardioides terrigena TaxID=424797 RepID=UPI00131ED609|nr:hypothetical protein [Nocardioides terrigena]